MTRKKYLSLRKQTRLLKNRSKQRYLYSILRDVNNRQNTLLEECGGCEFDLPDSRLRLFYKLEQMDSEYAVAIMNDVIENGIHIAGTNNVRSAKVLIDSWIHNFRHHNDTLYMLKLDGLTKEYNEQYMGLYMNKWRTEALHYMIKSKAGTLEASLVVGYVRALIEIGGIETVDKEGLEAWLLPARLSGMELKAY